MDNNFNLEEIIEKFGDKFDAKFIEQRKVFLWGPVHDESAKQVVNRLLFLEANDPGQEITFYINSPGGVVTSGLVMIDAMNMISSPVKTVCMGMCASMGAMLLSQGAKGKREIWENGRVMIHQPSIGGAYGQASDLEITAAQMQRTKETLAKMLAESCGKSLDEIMRDFDRDYWMNSSEALAYGIVDKISKKI
ncbi:MAG: ATP-dependent Clp protease proteolytic subunit [Chitinophagales bacterium]|nr:ATP-dependent Clp protease proteolytic subunit [Bacteroidota bacterium]MCB9257470.1 ATP-dependent Clp protease proteolytic subunit [Chitinophagales bacterium]